MTKPIDCCVLNARQKQWLDEIEDEIQAKLEEAMKIVAYAQGYHDVEDWLTQLYGRWPGDIAEQRAASPMVRLEMAAELIRTALRDTAGTPFWDGPGLRQAYTEGKELPPRLQRICEENYGEREGQ